MIGIDRIAIQHQLVTALPSRARWIIHNVPLDFDFARAASPLQFFGPDDIIGGEPDKKWLSLLLFGERDYCEGGGSQVWLGVHERTSKVFGLDIERPSDPLFLLNTNVARFVRSFALFDAVLRQETAAIGPLAEEAARVDPEAFVRSEWRMLVEHLQLNVLEL